MDAGDLEREACNLEPRPEYEGNTRPAVDLCCVDLSARPDRMLGKNDDAALAQNMRVPCLGEIFQRSSPLDGDLLQDDHVRVGALEERGDVLDMRVALPDIERRQPQEAF